MKTFICIWVLIFCFGITAHANDAPMDKLYRGSVNILTSPFEIPRELRAHWITGSEKTFHISAWLVCGFVKGLAMVPARAGSGLWDLITFPIYTESLKKPDFVFEDWPKRKEGVIYKNIGDK